MSKEKEQVLDEQITPLMKQVADLCRQHGIHVLASFEYGPGKFCTTAIMDGDACDRLRVARSIIMDGFAALAVQVVPGSEAPVGPAPKGKPS